MKTISDRLTEAIKEEFGVSVSTSAPSPTLNLPLRVTDNEWLSSLSKSQNKKLENIIQNVLSFEEQDGIDVNGVIFLDSPEEKQKYITQMLSCVSKEILGNTSPVTVKTVSGEHEYQTNREALLALTEYLGKI